jgi:hypothetical protein
VSSVTVPFCDTRIARHKAQVKILSPLENLLSSFSNPQMLGALMYLVAALFVAQLVVKDLLHGRWSHSAIVLESTPNDARRVVNSGSGASSLQ